MTTKQKDMILIKKTELVEFIQSMGMQFEEQRAMNTGQHTIEISGYQDRGEVFLIDYVFHTPQQSERDKVLEYVDCILTGYESYKHISGKIIFPEDPTVTISLLKKDLEKLHNEKSINVVNFVKWAGLEVLYFAYCKSFAELRQEGKEEQG